MDTISAIDARIHALELELVTLRRRRNELFAPIYRLPPELVVEVLKHVQHNDYRAKDFEEVGFDGIFPSPPRTYGRDWVYSMAMCQRWRETALEARELWQRIEARTNASWRNLCIQRAQGLPSILYTRYGPRELPSGQDRSVSKVTLTQLCRAVEAYLSDSGSGTFPDIFKHIECPSMKSLTLHAYKFVVTASLMGGNMLSLTSLDLYVGNIQAWPECPNLRYLKLECTHSETDVTGRIVMKGLERSRTLEVLYLIFDMGDNFNVPSDCVGTKDLLPALKILRLKCTIEACQQLALALLAPGPRVGLQIDADPYEFYALREESALQILYRDLIARLLQYCNNRLLNTMHAQVSFSNQATSAASIHLTSSSKISTRDPVDVTKPFCVFRGPFVRDCLDSLDYVGILRLDGDRVGPTSSAVTEEHPNPEDIDLMDNLDTVIVENPKTIIHVTLLGKWLMKRKAEGRKIRSLQIINPATEKAKASLVTLSDKLLHQKVVAEVNWSS
jgi:hypothetical protein